RFRSYGAQGVLKKHPFCGAFLVFWGFKFLSIKQKVEAAARKYAYLKNKRSPDIGGVSNFDNLPHCMTVNEALNAILAKNKDNEKWGIPAGFRG
uniref:hypothetical protein n=1 Tax=Escherichia coli TaxID=562 RepID=UPI001F40099B